ncbi:MAG: hypothetical protein UT84_C0033G0006 [Candidatus Curtissbacteria bacterium GW2011_GWA1_40_16]|uniref:Peptidase C39-like domain-containing protein n=2 Tax=Microgenomates group TaxID=1794810 RepID=A0A0G0UGP5_9BACT|nr:MAG: hypothetical protein UT84_C0033G0006 [Candidatus Curtissbacteria bacterium GW2011_GWA1_40_16]KKS12739.1 MAG: hypothetical protein UU67_C0043G0013 [Candidatus Daviesbacteria bacterium GW2011_GWB1_41_5]
MKSARILFSFLFAFLLLFLSTKPASAEINIFKPEISWQRSTEASDQVVKETTIGSGVQEALALPLDPNQVVFDNGVYNSHANGSSIPPHISYASWSQYSSNGTSCGPIFDLRHFQAKFNLENNIDISRIENFVLRSPYYQGSTFPINDNAYIYLNGNFVKRLGTSHGATNIGMGGTAPYANETDGWIDNGDLGGAPAQFLHSGQNVIDVVAGEWCLWGGMGKLELVLEGQFPTVPYFSQKDPLWGTQEYDHANSLSLSCGKTIAQCGCALTSAAMLLKYYGVDRSPDSLPTTPENLNNWLKNNKGYTFGSVRWPSIASYSITANEKFGTQKIRFVGFGQSNDFTTLNTELASNRPVILSVKNESHFVVATGIQGITYSINDPISQSITTLQGYNNVFQGMRLYAPTSTDLSTIYISTPAPTEILITDSSGRRAGKDPISGIIYTEIPNSFYFLEPALVDDSIENAPLPPSGSGIITLAIINPESGVFNIQVSNLGTNVAIDFAGYDQDGEISTKEFSQTIPQGGTQEYTFNYSPEQGSQIQVTQIVEIDVKPGSGSDPNSLNLKSNGVIPVAILTTPSFDATQVDVSTVRFGPNQAKEIHNKGHLEDIDGDGDIDLVLHFKTKETGIQSIDTEACLTGTTSNGIPIQGCDTIKIIH